MADENGKRTASTSVLPEFMIPTSLAASTTMGPEISIADFGHAHHASLADVKHHHPVPSFRGAAMLSTTTTPSVFSLPSSSLHLSPAADPTAPDGMKSMVSNMPAAHMSATALLQKAAQMGATASARAYNPDSGHSHSQFLDGPGQAEQWRFLKSLDQDMHARTGNSSNVMMVDFLGVGGAPRPALLSQLQLRHQFHQQQQQLNSHGQSTAVDKSTWGDL